MKYLSVLLIFIFSSCIWADEYDDIAKQVLYPMMRITHSSGAGGGGSATCIFSDENSEGEYDNFAITNHHVINDAIHIKKEWDNLTESYKHSEDNDLVICEIFSYANNNETIMALPVTAEIYAYTKDEDLAILKIHYPFKIKHVAKIIPENKQLKLFQPIIIAGCPLLLDPTFSQGSITDMYTLIDKKVYIGGNAQVYFGNSGGAVYASFDNKYYYCGIPSRVTRDYNQTLTYLAYYIGPKRIYKFIKKHKLDFLIDKNKTPKDTQEEREKEKRDKRQL